MPWKSSSSICLASNSTWTSLCVYLMEEGGGGGGGRREGGRGHAISAYHESIQLGLSYTPAVNPRCWSLNYCTLH